MLEKARLRAWLEGNRHLYTTEEEIREAWLLYKRHSGELLKWIEEDERMRHALGLKRIR